MAFHRLRLEKDVVDAEIEIIRQMGVEGYAAASRWERIYLG